MTFLEFLFPKWMARRKIRKAMLDAEEHAYEQLLRSELIRRCDKNGDPLEPKEAN